MSVLKGYLSPIMDAPVTFVNAPLIAEKEELKLQKLKNLQYQILLA